MIDKCRRENHREAPKIFYISIHKTNMKLVKTIKGANKPMEDNMMIGMKKMLTVGMLKDQHTPKK